jgi:DNA-binding Xre family transcriptional regulator
MKKEGISSITVQVIQDEQDPEQLLLDLGTELCEQLGWQVGDSLTWTDNQDGSWTLIKPPQ